MHCKSLLTKKNINVFNLEVLIDHGLAQKKDLIKVLGRGKLKSAIQVTVHAFPKQRNKPSKIKEALQQKFNSE